MISFYTLFWIFIVKDVSCPGVELGDSETLSALSSEMTFTRCLDKLHVLPLFSEVCVPQLAVL